MRSLLILVLSLMFCSVYGQQLSGMVTDKQTGQFISGAIIRSSKATVLSDYHGQFTISVKNTGDTIKVISPDYTPYQIAITSSTTTLIITLDKQTITLKEVKISAEKNRIADSLETRKMFAKNFNAAAPKFKDIVRVTPGVGLVPVAGLTVIPSELIKAIAYKGSREYKFKKRLVTDENDKYIDSRFNKTLIAQITKLQADSLSDFMDRYRPTATAIKRMTDYDIRTYIKKSLISFKAGN